MDDATRAEANLRDSIARRQRDVVRPSINNSRASRHIRANNHGLNPRENPGLNPTAHEREAWRRMVRERLNGRDGEALRFTYLACAAPPATHWQRHCTTFFVCCKAVNIHPRQFLLGHAGEQNIVTPGFLRENNYRVPRVTRMEGFLSQAIDEAALFNEQGWNRQVNSILSEYAFMRQDNGEEIGVLAYPQKPTRDGLVELFNVARRFLWALWVTWPEAETRDVWDDMLCWAVENLRDVERKTEFERRWRAKVDDNIRRRREADAQADAEERPPQAEAEAAAQEEAGGEGALPPPAPVPPPGAQPPPAPVPPPAAPVPPAAIPVAAQRPQDISESNRRRRIAPSPNDERPSSRARLSTAGAVADAIRQEETNGVEGGREEDDCPICFYTMEVNATVVELNHCCGATSHLRCFTQMILTNENYEGPIVSPTYGGDFNCYMCRVQVTSLDIVHDDGQRRARRSYPGNRRCPMSNYRRRRALANERIAIANRLRDEFDRSPAEWETDGNRVVRLDNNSDAREMETSSDEESNQNDEEEEGDGYDYQGRNEDRLLEDGDGDSVENNASVQVDTSRDTATAAASLPPEQPRRNALPAAVTPNNGVAAAGAPNNGVAASTLRSPNLLPLAESYPVPNTLYRLDEEDPVLQSLLHSYRVQYGEDNFAVAIRGALCSQPLRVWSAHHGTEDTRPNTDLPRLVRTGAASQYTIPGQGFRLYGNECLHVLEVFLTACSHEGIAPDRWEWDYVLVKLMEELNHPPTPTSTKTREDLQNLSVFVSPATRGIRAVLEPQFVFTNILT